MVDEMHNKLENNIGRETVKLVAFLLSDASMHLHKLPRGKIKHRISLEAVDKNMCTEFQRICSGLTNSKININESEPRKTNWSRIFRVQKIVSDELAQKLLDLSKTFRTKPLNGKITDAKIPEEIMSNTNEIKRDFLKIFASAEGSVHLAIDKQRKWWTINRWVQIKCCHPIIHIQLKKMLGDLEIRPRSVGPAIIIKGRENLTKFQKEIGFLDGCEVTNKSNSKWRGTEKNKLLNLVVLLFEIDKKCIQRMTKGEIFEWLKSLLEARNGF